MSYDPHVGLSPARQFARRLSWYAMEGFSFEEVGWPAAFADTFHGWQGSEADRERWGGIIGRHRNIWVENWDNLAFWELLVIALERVERQERATA